MGLPEKSIDSSYMLSNNVCLAFYLKFLFDKKVFNLDEVDFKFYDLADLFNLIFLILILN